MQKGQFPSRQISDPQVDLFSSLHTRDREQVSCLCLPTVWSTSPGLLVWPPPFSSQPTSGPLDRGKSVGLKCQTIQKSYISKSCSKLKFQHVVCEVIVGVGGWGDGWKWEMWPPLSNRGERSWGTSTTCQQGHTKGLLQRQASYSKGWEILSSKSLKIMCKSSQQDHTQKGGC